MSPTQPIISSHWKGKQLSLLFLFCFFCFFFLNQQNFVVGHFPPVDGRLWMISDLKGRVCSSRCLYDDKNKLLYLRIDWISQLGLRLSGTLSPMDYYLGDLDRWLISILKVPEGFWPLWVGIHDLNFFFFFDLCLFFVLFFFFSWALSLTKMMSFRVCNVFSCTFRMLISKHVAELAWPDSLWNVNAQLGRPAHADVCNIKGRRSF